MRRSREGAWIEISAIRFFKPLIAVAPARERGLKCTIQDFLFRKVCRSREGAWIEIMNLGLPVQSMLSRSREGAWIEILTHGLAPDAMSVAPARERGLKWAIAVNL